MKVLVERDETRQILHHRCTQFIAALGTHMPVRMGRGCHHHRKRSACCKKPVHHLSLSLSITNLPPGVEHMEHSPEAKKQQGAIGTRIRQSGKSACGNPPGAIRTAIGS
ncbi:hypothetical protein MACH05_15380 [Qipengyuania nanhaisediminis]